MLHQDQRNNFMNVEELFISKTPWPIPISIEGVNPTQINELPLSIFIITLVGVQLTQENILLQL